MARCLYQVWVLFRKISILMPRPKPVQQSAKGGLKSSTELGGTARVLKVKHVFQSFAESMSKSV